VWAAVGGAGTEDTLRAAYITASRVDEPSDTVLGEEGRKLQNKIWVRDLVSHNTLLESDSGCFMELCRKICYGYLWKLILESRRLSISILHILRLVLSRYMYV
jgi:hypothetical protein